MAPSQIPAMPTGIEMSPHYNLILAINITVFAAVLAWTIRDARRSGSAIPVLIMLGAAVASLMECAFDAMVLVNWADSGHTPLYCIFDRSVPTWMVFAYPWFIGGMGYWMYRRLQQGMNTRQLWTLYLFAWGANLFLEVPALQIGNIYTYYGNQPFRVLGFPLWMAWTNALMPILLACAVHAFRDTFTGLRSLLVVPVVTMAVGGAQIMIGWPIWLALNSGAGYGVTHAAALVTLGMSLTVVYLVSVKFCVPATAAARESATAQALRGASNAAG